MTVPKLFVSYSWTSPSHEAWVVQLATELRESGVDVVLDKWDLKEGHDAHVFMEKMVTDANINKVVLICDKAYVEKADGRTGGVGTEAQIISPEIYGKVDQNKFVAIVREHDEQGNAYVPAYFRSRIHIDLSDPSRYAENFEQLLRWVYNQPLYKKPDLGRKPSFLLDEPGKVSLGTSNQLRRAIDALRNNRDHAIPTTSEYLSMFSEGLEKFRLDGTADPFDDAVVQSIDSFLPYRNEAIEIFLSLSLYRDTDESRSTLHRFFEQLIPYMNCPQHISGYREWDFDNFRFIIHELFLYAIASLIRYERFESTAYLLTNDYYMPDRSNYGRNVMVPFGVFREGMSSLVHRNKRLQKNRLSLRADLIEQRCKGVGIEFRHLMQADFILFMRNHLDGHPRWWPETLLYADRHSGPFEVFARSRSTRYFDRVKILLGVNNKSELKPILDAFAANPRLIPTWEFDSFNPVQLLGFEELATKP